MKMKARFQTEQLEVKNGHNWNGKTTIRIGFPRAGNQAETG